MVDVAKVRLFGKEAGTVRWNERRNVAEFEYADNFNNSGIEPSPIMMPVREGRVYSFGGLNWNTYNGLPGMLADSLPDTYGRALFDNWLKLTGRTSGNPVESLCFLGKRCMGALEFEPAIAPETEYAERFEIATLVDVARDALLQKEQFGTNLTSDRKNAIAAILSLGTSAGGQRAKALIAYNKDSGEVRSGQIEAPEGFDYYLLKLDGVTARAGFRETENYGRLEYSFYRLAKDCGIEMTECSLIEENGRAHFLTKRFDRESGKKIHMQTLCGIAHYDFHLHLAYSYEQAFNIMRSLRLPYSQAEEMFRRIVFNVVLRNQDDHTKNISFLMDEKGKWRLSPAYDMGYAYNPDGLWTRTHQMSINGKFDNLTRQDLLACAASNNIKNAAEIIDRVYEHAAEWGNTARNCGVPHEMITAIEKHLLLNI